MVENEIVKEPGVSRKLFFASNCASGILGLASNADDKLPFAYIVLGMFVAYQVGQGFLDWLKLQKEAKERDRGPS